MVCPYTPSLINDVIRYVFDSDTFWPLGWTAGGLPMAGCKEEIPGYAGKNFLFTTEITYYFSYTGTEYFDFNGDDDVWVFINGKLALDLGGIHSALGADLDVSLQEAYLGLEVTQPPTNYKMSIFHAERQTSGSNFRTSDGSSMTHR